MGPEYWLPGRDTSLKKCVERTSDSCDPAETDGCCAVIPCLYCLFWTPYGGEKESSTAIMVGTGWSGTIGGASWFGYWEKNTETQECEFVVLIDEAEVYRKSCADGQSCRDSSDSVETTILYEPGVLEWERYEPRPLEYVQDADTNCTRHFCGECECSCDELCVTILETDGTLIKGEIPDISEPCDGPLWSGTVGYYDLSIRLSRDEDGECIIVPTVNGVEMDPVSAPGCAAMVATFTLPDYTQILVECKRCSCTQVETYPCDCTWGTQSDGSLDGTYGSWGVLEAGVDTCDMEYLVGAGGSGTLPVSNKTWQEGECVVSLGFLHRIIAFPPLCMENDSDVISKRVLFIRKELPGDTPNIDNSQVEVGEWYAVVYAATTDTILGIYYEFETCCHNYTDTLAASSHAVWLRFPGVMLGAAKYTIGLYNQVNADLYGNCGFVKPTASPG